MNQISYIKIKDNLYVNTMSIEIPKEVEAKILTDEPSFQFLIFDRSGSMTGYLNDVMEVAKDYCSKLPEGSTVALGYFSGTNEYSLSVPYTLKKELGGVITTLDSYKSSLSMTNFLQILQKVNETASKLNNKASLFFFTDGANNSCPNRSVLETLKEWTQYAAVSMFVGCGWIERDMMQSMAQITNGSFIHLNKFNQIKTTLEDFGSSVEDTAPIVKVSLSAITEDINPIAITGKAVTEYIVDLKKMFDFRPSKKEYRGIFFTTTNKVKDAKECTDLNVTMEKGIRALALNYSQKNNIPMAMDLLNFIGDKYLIQSFYNSITPEEIAITETEVRKSIFYPKYRFQEGVVKNFLPVENAFCTLDAVNILADDPTAKMYVQDPDFEYERIGSKKEYTDGAFIEYPEDLAVDFNNIVMNQERLNLSISTSATGHVALDPDKFKVNPFTKEDLTKLGLSDKFKITSFRTYSIIADGKLQTTKLVMSDLSKETINKLGTIITRRKDGKYIVDFSSLPIINKQYVKMTSAKVLAENVWEEKKISDMLSVYKFFKKKTEEVTGKTFKSDLSEEANKFLYEHCYIKDGKYSPPTKTVAGDDEYEAYSFSIDLTGYSKAQAKAVIEKVDKGGKPTPREAIVAEAYGKYKIAGYDTKEEKDRVEELDKAIVELNKQLSPIRKNIQLSKFAIILGNKGRMDEFQSRDNMKLPINVKTIDGNSLTVEAEFKIEKIKVSI